MKNDAVPESNLHSILHVEMPGLMMSPHRPQTLQA
jgi:hypothetical protein